MRHRRHGRPAADFADGHDVDAEFLIAEVKGDDFQIGARLLDGVRHVRELPVWHRRKRRSRLKREIGWSGLGSGSVRSFGERRAWHSGGRHALLGYRGLPRFRAAGEMEFDLCCRCWRGLVRIGLT